MNLAQTINFLIIPESVLSVTFLIIFFLLFIFGVWLYKECSDKLENLKDNAEEMYEPVSNKLSPEIFIRSTIDKISPKEGVLEGIPDAFVSIGILATFIGLGVAIQSAADLLSTDTIELEKLIDLLGIIAFKFQTSVWGIFFSLMFKRFVVERYFLYRQKVIDAVREQLYEKERDGIRTLLEKQNQFLEQQESNHQKEFEEYTDLLSNKLNEIISIQTNSHAELMNQQRNLNDKLMEQNVKIHNENLALQIKMDKEYLANSNKQHEDQIAQQVKLQDGLFKHQDALFKQLTNFKQQQQNSDEVLQSLFNQQVNEIQNIHKDIAEYVKVTLTFATTAKQFVQNTNTFAGYVNDYRQEVENFKDNLKQTIDSSFEKLTSSLEELGEQQFDTLCEMKTGIENMQRIFLRDEDRFVEEIRRKLSTMLTDTGHKFKETLDLSIDKVSNDYKEVLQSFNEKFDNSIKKVNADYTQEVHHFGEVANELSKVIKGIDVNVQNLNEARIAEQKAIITTNQASYDKVETIISSFHTAMQEQLRNITTLYTEMDKLFKGIESTNNSTITLQNEYLRQFTNAFNSSMSLMHKEQRKDIEEQMNKLDSIVAEIKNISKNTTSEQIRINNDHRNFQNDILNENVIQNENLKQQMIEFLSGLNEKLNTSLNVLKQSLSDNQIKLIETMNNTSSMNEKMIMSFEKMPSLEELSNVLSKVSMSQLGQWQQNSLQRKQEFEDIKKELIEQKMLMKQEIIQLKEWQSTLINIVKSNTHTPTTNAVKVNLLNPNPQQSIQPGETKKVPSAKVSTITISPTKVNPSNPQSQQPIQISETKKIPSAKVSTTTISQIKVNSPNPQLQHHPIQPSETKKISTTTVSSISSAKVNPPNPRLQQPISSNDVKKD